MKIIGSDFDGTITTNKVILPETRKQIKQFRDAGNIFIIVTERSPQKFKDGIKKYDIDFFDYVICANGACLLYTSPSPRDRQKSRMPSSA